jgi:hypothetical protein
MFILRFKHLSLAFRTVGEDFKRKVSEMYIKKKNVENNESFYAKPRFGRVKKIGKEVKEAHIKGESMVDRENTKSFLSSLGKNSIIICSNSIIFIHFRSILTYF